jgi:GDP-L-fucose synthase
MAEKQKIIVTGGTGLVGNGIRAALEAEDPKLHENQEWKFLSSKDCNLVDPADVERLFNQEKPTHVIHLAAKVGGLFMNLRQKADMWSDNVLMNENILRGCRNSGVKKLVSCLSTCIFPDKTTYPIDETMLHDGPPHCSNEGYAYAKRMLEVASRCYREQYGCNFVSVIPTNIYGPFDNFNLEDGHVLPALIHKCKIAKEAGKPLQIKGTGKPLRQFVYSQDLGRIMLAVLRNYEEATPIILTPSNEISIGDVGHLVAKSNDYDKVEFIEGNDGQFKKTANGDKVAKFMKEVDPTFEFTTLEDGLAKTTKWFNDNFATARK